MWLQFESPSHQFIQLKRQKMFLENLSRWLWIYCGKYSHSYVYQLSQQRWCFATWMMFLQKCIIINLHLSNFSMLCMNWKSLVHDHFCMFRRNLIHHSQMYIMWLLNLLRLQNCTQQLGREGFYYSFAFTCWNRHKKTNQKEKKHRHEIFWTPAPTLCVTSRVPDLHNPHKAQVNIV